MSFFRFFQQLMYILHAIQLAGKDLNRPIGEKLQRVRDLREISQRLLERFTIPGIYGIVGDLAAKAFDPYPFILLNLVLSCVAAIQAPLIMMSQNRQEEKDRQRAENDYKVNLKTEILIEDLYKKTNRILARQDAILKYLEGREADGVKPEKTGKRKSEKTMCRRSRSRQNKFLTCPTENITVTIFL